MLWGHDCDAGNVTTTLSMVARREYLVSWQRQRLRLHLVKVPSFLAIFLFPVRFSAIGQASRTTEQTLETS
jgi:hypothetical protein